jgi:putative flippase GtrA
MKIFTQIKRYLTVGLGAAITDFCVYGLLIRFAGFSPLTANLISRPAGGLFSFTGNKMWTFERNQLAGTSSQFLRFWITWLCAYTASELLVWFFSRQLDFGPFMTKVCAEAIACSGVFFVHRFWTFRNGCRAA